MKSFGIVLLLHLVPVLLYARQNIPHPTEIRTFVKYGQTFITFREVPRVIGLQYRIYRFSQPIQKRADLKRAVLLGVVNPGSAYFAYEATGQYINSPIGQTRFIIRDVKPGAGLGKGLEEGVGLYVHTVREKETGKSYYAVVTFFQGQLSAANFISNFSPAPVSEKRDSIRPVQVFSAKSRLSHVFTQFMAASAWNRQFEGSAYNFGVFLPAGYDQSQKKYPLFIFLDGYGSRYQFFPNNSPFEKAVTMSIDDNKQTWYFGFLKNLGLAGKDPGPVVNYTEFRILQALRFVQKRFRIDENRIYVYGFSMGASGALALGMRYPHIFSAVYCSQPMTDYTRSFWLTDVQRKWGEPGRNPRIKNITGLSRFDNIPVYQWQNHQKQMTERVGDEMAFIMFATGTEDKSILYATQGKPFYDVMNQAKRGWSSVILKGFSHAWTNFEGVSPMFPITKGMDWQYPKNMSFPAISRIVPMDKPGRIEYNLDIIWSTSWNNFAGPIIDTRDRYEIVFSSPRSQRVDITPRRLQEFKAIQGERLAWKNIDLKTARILEQGIVTVDRHRLITIPRFLITPNQNCLVIQRKIK